MIGRVEGRPSRPLLQAFKPTKRPRRSSVATYATLSARKPDNYWNDALNRRLYLEQVATKLKEGAAQGSSLPPLYSVSYPMLRQNGGLGFMRLYNRSPQLAVLAEYPELPWKPWQFSASTTGWWSVLGSSFLRGDPIAIAVLREYISDLEARLGIVPTDRTAWQSVAPYRLGTTIQLQLQFCGKLAAVLSRLYPEIDWKSAPEAEEEAEAAAVSFSQTPTSSFDSKKRREALDRLVDQNRANLTEESSWTSATLRGHGARKLLRVFQGSAASAVMTEYPERAWRPWLFAPVVRGFWAQMASQLHHHTTFARIVLGEFLHDLGTQHGIESVEDWQECIRSQTFDAHYALTKLGGLEFVLRFIYPDHQWGVGGDRNAAHGGSIAPAEAKIDWTDPFHRRAFLERLTVSSSLKTLYSLSLQQLHRIGGTALVHSVDRSPALAVQIEFPEVAFEPWKFTAIRGWWPTASAAFQAGDPLAIASIRLYFDYLQEKHTTTPLDAGELSLLSESERDHVSLLGGTEIVRAVLLDQKPSPALQLRQFSDQKLPWKFWSSALNRKAYLDFLKQQLGGSTEDLYKLTSEVLVRTGGCILLRRFGSSISSLVAAVYPAHHWKPWLFHRHPTGWFKDLTARVQRREKEALEQLQEYMDLVGSKVGVGASLEGWYSVGAEAARPYLTHRFKEIAPLSKLLPLAYPEHEWNLKHLASGTRAKPSQAIAQNSLGKKVDDIIPTDSS